MTLVNVFMQGLQMFSDVGIGPSIIQNARGHDPVFLNTAWTIQVIRGVLLAIAACLLALPYAMFYKQPALTWMIVIASANAILSGFYSTSLATQNRKLALGRISLIELISQAISLVVMVGWVVVSPTVWGLVAGGITASVVKLVLSHNALPGVRNRLCWDRESRNELLRFGRWIFLSTALTFAAGQADRLVFGTLASLETLGIYAIALTVAGMPTQIIQRVGSSVLFPLYSRLCQEGRSLSSGMDKARQPLLIASGVSLATLFVAGPAVIHILYDKRYYDAGWMLQALALGAWAQCLSFTSGAALMAMGKSNAIAAANFAKILAFVVAVPVGFWMIGFPGAVFGTIACEVTKYGVLAWSAKRSGLAAFRYDCYATMQFACSILLAWLAVTAVVTSTAPSIEICMVAGVVAGAVWLPNALRVLNSRKPMSSGDPHRSKSQPEPVGESGGAVSGTSGGDFERYRDVHQMVAGVNRDEVKSV
jgi:O-antigen/teichoic acid export membrane protein